MYIQTAKTIPECHHILPSGKKCRAVALRGKFYCYHHIGPARKRERPARPSNSTLNLPVLDSPAAIEQVAVTVVDALANGTLDPKRARLLLSGLRLASYNIGRDARPAGSPISSLRHGNSTEGARLSAHFQPRREQGPSGP